MATTTAPVYPIFDNENLCVRISKGNVKVGTIPSFSTLPGDEPLTLKDGRVLTNLKGTCGNLCECCKAKCYAVRFAKLHHNAVIPAYNVNTLLLREHPEKVRDAINEYCSKKGVQYFRFHTSGEIESVSQLRLYAEICKANPDVTFYIYTKAFDLLQEWFCELDAESAAVPENFVINLSAWKDNLVNYLANKHFQECNIFEYDEDHNSKFVHCPAIDKSGHETGVTCSKCRRCLRKGNKTAVYPH
jgi:hypothetical protein